MGGRITERRAATMGGQFTIPGAAKNGVATGIGGAAVLANATNGNRLA